MGADKALLELGGRLAIERVIGCCHAAGIEEVIVVRREDAAALPELGARVASVTAGGEMADSLRAAAALMPATAERVVVFPVDHALVEAETVAALLARLGRGDCSIALPLFRERPGHPIAMLGPVFAEIAAPGAVLRDLVRRDPARVAVVPSANPWVHADLDHPEDLRAARCALTAEPWSTVAQMFRHRSHRSYLADDLAAGQLERLVDAARHASTSSYIQAYSVVAVRDPERRLVCSRLCGDQAHIVAAPVFLAICADLNKLAMACELHATSLQTQSFELFLQATIDAALLGQNLQLAAEAEGLGSCMIGGARNDPIAIAELLELPPGVFVLFGMTIGRPGDDPVPRGRMPLAGVLHDERYDSAAAAKALDGADEVFRRWARESNARGRAGDRPIDEGKGWTDRMARAFGERSRYVAARKELVAELRRLGFGLEGI
ncbi:MAG: NTP transferase domain-containing protein [Planctomycetes bacterium]|nr:NTP transferase domain-containing protein [Planctomycetota bacterium]